MCDIDHIDYRTTHDSSSHLHCGCVNVGLFSNLHLVCVTCQHNGVDFIAVSSFTLSHTTVGLSCSVCVCVSPSFTYISSCIVLVTLGPGEKCENYCVFGSVCTSDRTRNSKTIALIYLIFYARSIIPVARSSSKMIWIGTQ